MRPHATLKITNKIAASAASTAKATRALVARPGPGDSSAGRHGGLVQQCDAWTWLPLLNETAGSPDKPVVWRGWQ